MKKWILFLVLILAAQIGHGLEPILAEDEGGKLAVQGVIEEYMKGFNKGDLDYTMKWISPNYSSTDAEGVSLDYDNFKSVMAGILKEPPAYNTEFKIINATIKGNKAMVEVEFIRTILDQSTGSLVNKNRIRRISLEKESGSWKITEFRDRSKRN